MSVATAVQIVVKRQGVRTVPEHLGYAHTPEDFATLAEAGIAKLGDPGQAGLVFDAESQSQVASTVVKSSRLGFLIDIIRVAHTRLGFDIFDDEAFFHFVAAPLVE